MVFNDIDYWSEKLLVLTFGLTATYMFVTAELNYSHSARLFPMVSAGIVIICSVLLLSRSYLPDVLAIYMGEQNRKGGTGGYTVEEIVRNSKVITAATLAGYILLSHFAGLLIATPVFMVGYLVIFGQPKRVIIGLTILSTLFVYFVMEALNLYGEIGGVISHLFA